MVTRRNSSIDMQTIIMWFYCFFSEGGHFFGNAITPILRELSVFEVGMNDCDAIIIFIDDAKLSLN